MSSHKCPGCNEYSQLSRRRFMSLSSGFLAAAATPAWLPRVVLADSDSSTRDVIVSIFLRGGADALTLCVPYGERNYYNLRSTQAMEAPDSGSALRRTIDLDGFFGFAPAFSPLMEAYQDESLLVVHACGLNTPTRSHFDAMNFMEIGQDNPPAFLATGWLGRHLASTAPTYESSVLRAVGIGDGLQKTLAGAPSTLPIAALEEFGFPGDAETVPERREAIELMYRFAPTALKESASNTMQTIDLLEAIDFRGYQPAGGAAYPNSGFGTALSSAAALIKAEVGVEAIAVDIDGWDTHGGQGSAGGYLSGLMRGFANALAAFHKDLFTDEFTNVSVVAMSEFGRNCIENGSEGTDHGHGGLMMVLGGNVAGGRVLTEWPGLEREQLYEAQDLEITIDYRDVLTEILDRRAGNSDYASVFPDPSYSPVNRGVTL